MLVQTLILLPAQPRPWTSLTSPVFISQIHGPWPRAQARRRRPPPRSTGIDLSSSSSDSAHPSLVAGDSDASSLRQPRPTKKRNSHAQTMGHGWDAWRKGIKVASKNAHRELESGSRNVSKGFLAVIGWWVRLRDDQLHRATIRPF